MWRLINEARHLLNKSAVPQTLFDFFSGVLNFQLLKRVSYLSHDVLLIILRLLFVDRPQFIIPEFFFAQVRTEVIFLCI